MGTLSLPQAGRIYMDTAPLIYTIEAHERYTVLLDPLWQAAHDERIEVVTSELTFMEALIVPLRRGDENMIREYEAVLDGRFVRSLPITLAVLKRAARIRSEKTSLRTPDAIHLATSIEAGCSRFITNDAAFRKVHDLGVLVLDDFMA